MTFRFLKMQTPCRLWGGFYIPNTAWLSHLGSRQLSHLPEWMLGHLGPGSEEPNPVLFG